MLSAIEKIVKEVLSALKTDALRDYKSLEDAPPLDKIHTSHRWAIVSKLHNLAVDTSGLNETKCCFIGTICAYWIDQKQITKQDYVRGVSEFVAQLEDIVIDVPKVHEWTVWMICKCLFHFFGFFPFSNDLVN